MDGTPEPVGIERELGHRVFSEFVRVPASSSTALGYELLDPARVAGRRPRGRVRAHPSGPAVHGAPDAGHGHRARAAGNGGLEVEHPDARSVGRATWTGRGRGPQPLEVEFQKPCTYGPGTDSSGSWSNRCSDLRDRRVSRQSGGYTRHACPRRPLWEARLHRRFALAGITLIAALAAAAGSSPAHAQYPPDRPVCIVDRSAAAPGETLTVTGDRWAPDSAVDFDFAQFGPAFARDLGGAHANGAGTFVAPVRVPADAHRGRRPPGPHRLRRRGRPGDVPRVAHDRRPRGGLRTGLRRRRLRGPGDPGLLRRRLLAARQQVTLAFLSTPVALGSAPVRSDGSFRTTFAFRRGPNRAGTASAFAGPTPRAPPPRFVPLEVVAGRRGGGLATTGAGLLGLFALAVGLLVSATP